MALIINWKTDDLVILNSLIGSKTAYRFGHLVLISPAIYHCMDGLKGRELEKLLHAIPCFHLDKDGYNELLDREQEYTDPADPAPE